MPFKRLSLVDLITMAVLGFTVGWLIVSGLLYVSERIQ